MAAGIHGLADSDRAAAAALAAEKSYSRRWNKTTQTTKTPNRDGTDRFFFLARELLLFVLGIVLDDRSEA